MLSKINPAFVFFITGLFLLTFDGGQKALSFQFSIGKSFILTPRMVDTRSQLYPRIASGSSEKCMVVWQQGRNYFQSESGDIYATLVDCTGKPYCGEAISICMAGDSQELPEIAFGQDRYLIVWQDLRNHKDWDIYGVFLDQQGGMLDNGEFKISTGKGSQAKPMVTTCERGFLIVWQGYSEHFYSIYVALIGWNGKIHYNERLKYENNALYGGDPEISCIGDKCILSWNDEKSWKSTSMSGRMTGRFAAISVQDNGVTITDCQKAPTYFLKGGGRFAKSREKFLYCIWDNGKRGQSVAVAALFDPDKALPKKNLNKEKQRHLSGWNTLQMISLNPSGVFLDSPLDVNFYRGNFLVVGRLSILKHPTPPFQIVGKILSKDGIKENEDLLPVLHDSRRPVSAPTLADTGNGLIMVWEQEVSPGKNRIMSKQIGMEKNSNNMVPRQSLSNRNSK
ncbi:hypothetical protein [Desulfospira joergensenii]|uniref:hypothetical protein n=1 Tax=Desulfospira joergensenii TaxID=53329 RepID=UPI0003B4FF4A|nr:hypothetical protein [Desulfospira joergensenii]